VIEPSHAGCLVSRLVRRGFLESFDEEVQLRTRRSSTATSRTSPRRVILRPSLYLQSVTSGEPYADSLAVAALNAY
jgi:hypothetical protein